MLIPRVKCYYVLYKDVGCFQSIVKTWIILMNKSRPTETGNPQLHHHTCDTNVHVFVVTKESFESSDTFCVTWFQYNVHRSAVSMHFYCTLVSFVFSNRFRIQIFFEFKFAYWYLNLYCMASVLVLVLVLWCTWHISDAYVKLSCLLCFVYTFADWWQTFYGLYIEHYHIVRAYLILYALCACHFLNKD